MLYPTELYSEILAGTSGFEPEHAGVKVLCLTGLATSQWKLVPTAGIEPATYWLQVSCTPSCATPAHITCQINWLVGMTGFEPATPWSQTMCSAKLSHIPIEFWPATSQNWSGLSFSPSWRSYLPSNVTATQYYHSYSVRTLYEVFITNTWLTTDIQSRIRTGGPDGIRTHDLCRDRAAL